MSVSVEKNSMHTQSLNGQWQLSRNGSNETIPATVPGSVHTALLHAGQLKDPLWRDNEKDQMWVGETEWLYRHTFTIAEALTQHAFVYLRCHGLDTVATIFLNGTLVAKTDNMFCTFEFDVKSLLKAPGVENEIQILFAAPCTYARTMDKERGKMAGWVELLERSNSGAWMRKSPCNFGWDWGPMMTTSGIWRDVELVAYSISRIESVMILQEHPSDMDEVRLTITTTTDDTGASIGQLKQLTANVEIEKDGEVLYRTSGAVEGSSSSQQLTIHQPQLWWVVGLGSQPLYTVRVTLFAGDRKLDACEKRIGLRTLRLERREDEWGETFEFSCNNVAFFAKGANWIPATPYPGDSRTYDFRPTLLAAHAANMNMIRVWGGGTYEDDKFYDLCDELGLAVWQDFMFACGTYPTFDAQFMKNVENETRDNVKRLRHHACIALWCGNNEIEMGMADSPDWKSSMSWDDYSRLFDSLLPDVTKELDPESSYWPSSPHSPRGRREHHANESCGDSHLWDVWHGRKPFEWYRQRNDRFCSEFGFQSFPQPSVIAEKTLPEDRNVTSYIMEHFQRSGIGNSTIVHYMLDWFCLPTSFDGMVWLSQILQGMAVKYGVEHWRRNMPRTMGTLYWQLNDMWMGPSWSSLDWKGNWKALHYMAKKFYSPLMVSGVENVSDFEKTVSIYVTNDHPKSVTGTVHWTISDLHGRVIAEDEIEVTSAERSSKNVLTLDISEHLENHDARNILVWLDLIVEGKVVSDNLVLLCRPKHLTLHHPKISVVTEPNPKDNTHLVTLTSNVPALYVWLEIPGATDSTTTSFEDNFFHLRAHTPYTIQVTCPDISTMVVKSLTDTFGAQTSNFVRLMDKI